MSLQINGDRIREARVFRVLTITKLAEELGISKQMLSKCEHNKANLSMENFRKLIEILDFPMDFFTGTVKFRLKDEGTFYRSRLTATQAEKQPSETFKRATAVVRDFLEQYIEFPVLEELELPDDVSPEEAAIWVRNFWKLGDFPITDVLSLLEHHGLTVVSLDLGAKKVDARSGYMKINGRSYYIVLTNNDSNFYREQFTLAHELGHFVLHGDRLNPKDLDPSEYRNIEQEADTFASCFLMPKNAFEKDIRNIKVDELMNYVPLKTKWNVSIAAMIHRAKSLSLLNETQYVKLYKAISYKGWRKKEILDDEKESSKPRALNEAFRLVEEHTSITPANLASYINNIYGTYYPNEILSQILSIKLSEFSSNIIPLALKQKTENNLN